MRLADLAILNESKSFALSQRVRANVIVADWKRGVRYSTMYFRSVANGVVIDISAENIQFVGFSLGGQISGFFAGHIFHMKHHRIGKIKAHLANASITASALV